MSNNDGLTRKLDHNEWLKSFTKRLVCGKITFDMAEYELKERNVINTILLNGFRLSKDKDGIWIIEFKNGVVWDLAYYIEHVKAMNTDYEWSKSKHISDRYNTLKERMINKIIFSEKITNKETIKNLHEINLEYILMLYTKNLHKPVTKQEHFNQFIWIRKIADTLTHTYINNKRGELRDYYSALILYINQKLENICTYFDNIDLPLHTFSGLCGVNYILADSIVNSRYGLWNNKDTLSKTSRHYLYLDSIEDELTGDGFKENRNGMPLFWLVTERLMAAMDLNSELKEKMNDYIMHDMGMAEHMVTIKEDENGNKTVEKYYPELRIIK